VPDTPFWITGEICGEIARYNPGFDFSVFPSKGLRWLSRRHPHLLESFDLVHFLTPDLHQKFSPVFDEGVARVSTIFHVEHPADTDCVAGSDAVMTASRQWRDALRGRGVPPDKIFVVPLGVDPELFHPPTRAERQALRDRLRIAPAAFTVGFCAKRSSDVGGRKGIDVFLRAIEALSKRVPEVVAVMIGPGWSEFAAEHSRSGLVFRCIPFVLERAELAEVYRALDLFWVTSRIEGGPAPLLESMASGVGCVTTAVGVAEEVVVEGQNGFLAAFDDAARFAEVSAKLAQQPKERAALGARARARVLLERAWSQTAPLAGVLYREVLERRGYDGYGRGGVPPASGGRIAHTIAALEYDGFARSLEKMGEYASAARFARHALRRRPGHPTLWRHWARIAWRARGGGVAKGAET
jgi:glycosyltransferase involved in cell wall biosynthesis